MTQLAHAFNGVTHPAASKFRLLDGRAFEELCEDIRERGQLEPIWLDPDGYLLDGRNRKRACEAVGIEPIYATYSGDDPAGFIASKNVKRRHLTVVEQRDQRKEEAVRKHADGMSTRQIAAEVGVGHATVARDVVQLSHDETVGRSTKIAERRAYVVDQVENCNRTHRDVAQELGVSKSLISNDLHAARKAAPEPRANGKDRASVLARVERIRDLASQGHNSNHIARVLGLSEGGVGAIAAREGIELPSIRMRRLNHDKVVEALVQRVAFDYMTDSTIAVLDYSALSHECVADWVSSLSVSIASLKKLLTHLKELPQ